MRLILASNNAKKLAEMRALLAGLGVEIVSQREAGCDFESADSQVCVYQNFWQRKVKLWAMKSTLWYMDMFL